MEHKPLAELQAVADIKFIQSAATMTRERHLQRWIELLEGAAERKLRSLHEIEFLSRAQRRQCRTDNSPLTVAFEDPILRSAGLKSDRVGDCVDFFELSDQQMHHAFCSCHVGISLTGAQAAQRLHRLLWGENVLKKTRAAVSQWLRKVFAAQ
jgi:hypothetical protein